MFVRFVVDQIDVASERRIGVFHAMADLRDSGQLVEQDYEEVQQIRSWFNEHLEKPERFSRTKVAYRSNKSRGLSWFKQDAHEHIRHAHRYALLLEKYGVATEMLRAKRVGFVTYEDQFQVVAEPFADLSC